MSRHKAWFAASGLASILLLILTSLTQAAEIPPLRGRVNDYAQVLSQELAQSLENQLTRFENETGHQVALLTIPTLDGEDIEGFSIRVAERWKIGQKGFDNGVILVVAPKDRKLRLEVGYGLEGILPDALASRIIGQFIVPRFRDNDYSGGISSGLDAVLKTIRGEPLPEAARRKTRGTNSGSLLNLVPLVFLLLLFAGASPFNFFSRRRSPRTWMTYGRRHHPFYWGGGVGGGGFSGGSGGGGFSGGGGGFGGGGASGSW